MILTLVIKSTSPKAEITVEQLTKERINACPGLYVTDGSKHANKILHLTWT